MALKPQPVPADDDAELVPFDARHAARVVSWARTRDEMYWLAPRTAPPLTADVMRHWQQPGDQAYMLVGPAGELPVGYGEVNRLGTTGRRYWLGHVVVDPEWRGRGLGLVLTRQLAWQGFMALRAQEVSLVVFPGNAAAIGCYIAAGFVRDGYERHEFPAYGQVAKLVRMVLRAARFTRLYTLSS